MGSARFVGRVGGLAVALGVGLAIGGTAGIAWAEPDASAEATTASDTRASGGKTAGPSVAQSRSGDDADDHDADSDTEDGDDEAASDSAAEGTAKYEAADAEGERKQRTVKRAERVTDSTTETSTLEHVAVRDSAPAPVSPAPDPSPPAALAVMTATSSARPESVSAALPRTEYSVTSVGVGRGPSAVALSPDGARAYVANATDRTVSVVDTATGTLVKSVAVGGSASAVALSPDGSRAYIALKSASKLTVIDTATHSVISTVSVGWSPSAVAVNANGTRVYVSNPGSGTMSVIDATTNKKVTSVMIGSSPAGLAVNPTGTRVYVAVKGSDRVAVVNTATNRLITKVPVWDRPRDVAVSPDGSGVYVIHDAGGMSVINPAANTVSESGLFVGSSAPLALMFAAASSQLFIATATDTVSVIDTGTRFVEQFGVDTSAESGEHDIAVSADGRRIFVTDAADHALRMVTATVIPNTAPTVSSGPSVEGPEAVDGAVTGKVTIGDADGDPLTPTVTRAPTRGSVSVSTVWMGPGSSTYAYRYTPTPAARQQARQTPGEDSDTFTITVSDGGANVDVVVTVPILPSLPSLPTTSTTRIGVGPKPIGAMIAGRRLFTVNGGDGSISVVDTTTKQLMNTITGLGLMYPTPMVASPDGGRLYLGGDDSVRAIDVATGMLLFTLPSSRMCGESECFGGWFGPAGVSAMAINDTGTRVYIARQWVSDSGSPSTLGVLDTATRSLISNVEYGGLISDLEYVTGSASGARRLYGANGDYRTISAFDADTFVSTGGAAISVPGGWPAVVNMGLSPDEKRLYAVVNPDLFGGTPNTIVVVDTTTNKQTVAITVAAGAKSVAVSPDGARVYVTHVSGNFVTVIDASTNSVLGTIPSSALGGDYSSMAVGANGTLYVTNAAANAVYAVTL